MGRPRQSGGSTKSLVSLPQAEHWLSTNDPILANIIIAQSERWPCDPTEDPVWGLVRMVMAQQISTHMACRLAERVRTLYPSITKPSQDKLPEITALRACGLPERRAQCCISILTRSEEIRAKVRQGQLWTDVIGGIKGIGPWTLGVFRVMVLREPDELPLGDVGLERAITNLYGKCNSVQLLAEKWRPYRSVACWYLWRTLGNEQLG